MLGSSPSMTALPLRQRLQIPDRPARRGCVRGVDDGVRVDAEMAVEVGDRAGLAEMLDTERLLPVAVDAAEPGERRRVAVQHRDDAAIARELAEQALDMAGRLVVAALARPLGRLPAGIEPVGRGDGE